MEVPLTKGVKMTDISIKSASNIEKPTMLNLLKNFGSVLALDQAPLHTGVVIWNGSEFENYYFRTPAVSKDAEDPFRLYKLRRDFKSELKNIVQDRTFDYVIVENVFAGDNYETFAQLLTINNVIDELIFEGSCYVLKKFYRWEPSAWLSRARRFYKQKGKLRSKIETQGILEYLEDDYYLKNKNLSNKEKEDICFEDTCDARGMILAVVAEEKLKVNMVKSIGLKLSDIKMVYVEDLEETYSNRDKRIANEEYVPVDLNFRALETSIINQVIQNPDDVLCAYLPVDKLGRFGLEKKFKFYQSGEGYLLFYKKGKN